MRVFAQTVAQAAACITYSHDITHWDVRDGVHEALGGLFFSFVDVFSSETPQWGGFNGEFQWLSCTKHHQKPV